MKTRKDLSVIFYGIKDSDPWLVRSNYFILKDLLKYYPISVADYVDQNQPEKPNRTYDVFVYHCRAVEVPCPCHFGQPLSFDEVKSAVEKYKPKIIIQLGDEWEQENNDIHNTLSDYCKLFLRQHRHEKQAKEYTSNIVQIPVGYSCDYLTGSTNIKKIKDRELSWSWVGQMTVSGRYKSDRDYMIREFWKIWNNTTICDSFNKFNGSKVYKLYSNSIFVPCGRGNWSLECFRNYEATISGAIPVVAASRKEIEETFTFSELPPWIFASSWEEAVNKCIMLLNKDELQIMQDNNLAWWNRIMNYIRNRIDESLSDSIKLNNIVSENKEFFLS